MLDLKQIMLANKVTKDSRHGYAQFYEKYLESYRSSAKKVLEIGVDTGVSISAWLGYFTNAAIYGMDIDYSAMSPGMFNAESRVTLFPGDQGNPEDLSKFIQAHGGNFDIIIDDGGHTMQQQQLTFKTYFKHLAPGGVYVIEDLHTSYLNPYDYGQHKTPVTTLSLCKHLETGLKDKTYSTEFITADELNKIKDSIKACKVEKNVDDNTSPLDNSEICFILKK
jgi:predicted O-methyltransferase YrrM